MAAHHGMPAGQPTYRPPQQDNVIHQGAPFSQQAVPDSFSSWGQGTLDDDIANVMAGIKLSQQPVGNSAHFNNKSKPAASDSSSAPILYQGWRILFRREKEGGKVKTYSDKSLIEYDQRKLQKLLRDSTRTPEEQYKSLDKAQRQEVEKLIRKNNAKDPRFEWIFVYAETKVQHILLAGSVINTHVILMRTTRQEPVPAAAAAAAAAYHMPSGATFNNINTQPVNHRVAQPTQPAQPAQSVQPNSVPFTQAGHTKQQRGTAPELQNPQFGNQSNMPAPRDTTGQKGRPNSGVPGNEPQVSAAGVHSRGNHGYAKVHQTSDSQMPRESAREQYYEQARPQPNPSRVSQPENYQQARPTMNNFTTLYPQESLSDSSSMAGAESLLEDPWYSSETSVDDVIGEPFGEPFKNDIPRNFAMPQAPPPPPPLQQPQQQQRNQNFRRQTVYPASTVDGDTITARSSHRLSGRRGNGHMKTKSQNENQLFSDDDHWTSIRMKSLEATVAQTTDKIETLCGIINDQQNLINRELSRGSLSLSPRGPLEPILDRPLHRPVYDYVPRERVVPLSELYYADAPRGYYLR